MLGAFLQKGDVISGAVLAALGVFIITQARAWDYYTLDGPGPGFFPFWYGVAMVVLSLLLVLNAARADSDGEAKAVDWPAPGGRSTVWLAFALSVGLMDFARLPDQLRAAHVLHRGGHLPPAAHHRGRGRGRVRARLPPDLPGDR